MSFVSKDDLVAGIVAKVGDACAKRGIKEGAIVVKITAKTPTSGWFDFREGCVSEEFIRPLNSDGSTYVHDEFGEVLFDAEAVAEEKIGGVKRVMAWYDETGVNPTPEQCTSGSLPDDLVVPGIVNWKGAIAIQIGALVGGGCGRRGTLVMTIYIGVAGGGDDVSEEVAWEALPFIREEVGKDEWLMLPANFYK